jgi:BlaI family penicillinase repressor
MRIPDITEAEWVIMEALWEDAPQTASELAKQLHRKTKWAENTVRTMLTRLVGKGALLTGENSGGTKVFSPAFPREACVGAESESFMQRVFQGASKPLLVHFAQHARLSPDDVRELKQLLDQSLEK